MTPQLVPLPEIYVRERNAMLLRGDIDVLIAFMHKWGYPPPSDRMTAELILHKLTTAVPSLPLEHRRRSKTWLTKRGSHSLDDGEL